MKIDFGFKGSSIITVLLLAISTAFGFAIVGTGINLLFIIVSIFFIVLNLRDLVILKSNYKLIYVQLFILLLPLLTNINTFKFSTYAYSVLFLLVYLSFVIYLKRVKFSIVVFISIFKNIIYLYFVVSVLQIILLVLFNCKFNFIWQKNLSEGLRFNSLATEPSYTGIFVTISLYCLNSLKEIYNNNEYSLKDIKEDYRIWFSVLFVIIASQSSYSLVIFLLYFVFLLPKKYFIISSTLVVLLFAFGLAFKLSSFDRFYNLLIAFFTMDINNMVNADHSGTIRIAPIFVYLSNFDVFNIYYWFGFGMNYSKYIIAGIVPGIIAEEWAGPSFMPEYLFVYGIIPMLIFFLLLSKYMFTRNKIFEIAIIFLIVMNCSYNTQLFWFIIISISTIKYFQLDEK